MKSIKVPKEIQDVFAEADAARRLAELSNKGWWPSLKAIFYMHRAVKLESFGWRALSPEGTGWTYNLSTGIATKAEPEDSMPKSKSPRKPRVKKELATPAAPTPTTKGAAQ